MVSKLLKCKNSFNNCSEAVELSTEIEKFLFCSKKFCSIGQTLSCFCFEVRAHKGPVHNELGPVHNENYVRSNNHGIIA